MNFKRFKYREKSKAKVEVILFAVEKNSNSDNCEKLENLKKEAEFKILIILRQPLFYL